MAAAALELAYIRYVRSSGRAAEANELAAQLVLADRADTDATAAAIELIGGDFPVLEQLCRELAGTPCYTAARALGASLGKLRWLPPLLPIVEAQPFEAANAAIHGAVAAMMARSEPHDADRIRATLLPAARALHTDQVDTARVAKARRFRHGAMGEVAAALAACKATDDARALVDELLADAPALDADARVCAFAAAAPALVLLGQQPHARDLVQRAHDLVEAEWGENLDGYGDPILDTLASADAHTRHLASWQHGTIWTPEPPVASVFHNPYRGFGVERRQLEALSHAVDHLARAGKLDAALDVIDGARASHPEQVGSLVLRLVSGVDRIDAASLARLEPWLASVPDHAVAAIAAALPRLTHADTAAWGDTRYTDLALRLVRRAPDEHASIQARVAIACALGGRATTRDQAAPLAREVLAFPRADEPAAIARRLLDDLATPRAPVREIIYEGSSAHSVEDHLMILVYLFGNGLDSDTRFTASTPDAILMARGLIMGTGSCRRVPDLLEHPLYRPGDECYRQGDDTYALLGTIPDPR